MKIKIHNTDKEIWCLYCKEPIEIGEKYVEVKEDYLGTILIKTYKYYYLDMLVEEHLENFNEEPEVTTE